MKNKILQQHKLKTFNISMTQAMADIMQHWSKSVPGCPRPKEGSISHGVFHAVMICIEQMNSELKKCNPEVYCKSMK